MPLELAESAWRILPGRAAFWEKRHWLVVADVHFGKAAAFRALGVPVPAGTTAETLARLDRLIEQEHPRAIVCLGDLFHARESHSAATMGVIDEWRSRHPSLPLVLVEGNHDRSAGAPPEQLGIQMRKEPWLVDGMAFCHHPQRIAGAHAMAGHHHPAVWLSGRGDDAVRLPCYWLRPELTVLPAFGSFTGGAGIEREPGDRVIAIADERLYEVP